MTKEFICIVCPRGCNVRAEYDGPDNVVITGNGCVKGDTYVREEIFAPKRTLTAIVKTDSPSHPVLPVKSDKPVPKNMICDFLNEIYSLKIKLPVKTGDILISNVKESGINIIATRTLSRIFDPE
jgi:CxxC motif-containing protein